MAKKKLDKEVRKAIVGARGMIEAIAKADANESETRRRLERIFELVMGYDPFKHITREHAVHGAGETEHCDFAIQIKEGEDVAPAIMVELKRVNVDLGRKHLKQVSSYAINAGCEWILLTNGREWQLHHVTFGQPPETKLIEAWNILHDEPAVLAEKFELISYKSVKRGNLDARWQKANVLTSGNVLRALLSEDSIKLMRRSLRKVTGVSISPEEVVGAVRRILNEAAATEMDSIKISLPERKTRSRPKKKATDSPSAPEPDAGEESGLSPSEEEDSGTGTTLAVE